MLNNSSRQLNNNMKNQCMKAGAELVLRVANTQLETARCLARKCFGNSSIVKGGQGCSPARLDANHGENVSTGTRVRLPVRFSRTVSFLVLLVLAVKAAVAQEIGELSPRTVSQGSEAALSVLQNSRNAVQKRLANIAAQADPLAEAVAAYRANPTPETALKLLHREAVVAGIGAKESESIATEATTVSRACAGLAAQTQSAAEMLRPGLDKAARARVEYSFTRNAGFNELKQVHRSLVERGVTNEVTMSAAERRKGAHLCFIAV